MTEISLHGTWLLCEQTQSKDNIKPDNHIKCSHVPRSSGCGYETITKVLWLSPLCENYRTVGPAVHLSTLTWKASSQSNSYSVTVWTFYNILLTTSSKGCTAPYWPFWSVYLIHYMHNQPRLGPIHQLYHAHVGTAGMPTINFIRSLKKWSGQNWTRWTTLTIK